MSKQTDKALRSTQNVFNDLLMEIAVQKEAWGDQYTAATMYRDIEAFMEKYIRERDIEACVEKFTKEQSAESYTDANVLTDHDKKTRRTKPPYKRLEMTVEYDNASPYVATDTPVEFCDNTNEADTSLESDYTGSGTSDMGVTENNVADLVLPSESDNNGGFPYLYTLSERPTIKVQLDPFAICPTRAHTNDAGLDLYAVKSAFVPPHRQCIFETGVHVAIPDGYVGLLTSRSGLMAFGMTSRGTIDAGYTGPIRVVLFNHSNHGHRINAGDRISQLVIVPCITPDVEVVDKLEQTERGEKGFGSTGR